MISITKIFENKLKTGFREAGKSALAGAGLGIKGIGQAATSTGEALHDRFTKKEKVKVKEKE
jgi:hypothetical protein